MIPKTNAGNKPTRHKAKVPNMVKYGLIMKAWQTFLVSPKWKINIASLMIPHWNQPSMFTPKMVLSDFSGVQRVYINTNQNTRLVP